MLCTNFLDPGLQHYGGRLFQASVDKGERVFATLPPPVSPGQAASLETALAEMGLSQATAPADVIMAVEQQLRQAQRGQPRGQPPPNRPRGGVPPSPAPAACRPPSPDMSRYMNSGGGCFAASCTVRLHPDGLGGSPSSMSSMVRTVRMD